MFPWQEFFPWISNRKSLFNQLLDIQALKWNRKLDHSIAKQASWSRFFSVIHFVQHFLSLNHEFQSCEKRENRPGVGFTNFHLKRFFGMASRSRCPQIRRGIFGFSFWRIQPNYKFFESLALKNLIYSNLVHLCISNQIIIFILA